MTKRFFLLLLLLFWVATQIVAQNDTPLSLSFDGIERYYQLSLPSPSENNEPIPLIIALHSTASSGKALQLTTGLDALANEQGFVVAYPDSLDLRWNDGGDAAQITDDVGFIGALINHLTTSANINPERVYIAGIGSGAGLAFRLACEKPDTIAGIAAVSTLMWEYHTEKCTKTTGSISVLLIHGTNDTNYPINGKIAQGVEPRKILSREETLKFWALRNSCPESEIPDSVANSFTLSGCSDATTIALVSVEGGGPLWPHRGMYYLNNSGVDAAQIIVQFFSAETGFPTAQGKVSEQVPRSYTLYIPSDYTPDAPMPLVLMLHGKGGTGASMASSTEMNKVANEKGFIVVYPDGLTNQWGYYREWPFSPDIMPDDTTFLSNLISDLLQDVNVDASRIYVAGLSNGGFMTQRLACEDPDQYAAYASVAATAFGSMVEICEDTKPVPFVLIHGTDDPIVPWRGMYQTVEGQGFWLSAPAEDTIGFWASHNGCGGDFSREELPELGNSSGTKAQHIIFPDCEPGSATEMYLILGGGHTWPGVDWGAETAQLVGPVNMDFHASEALWEFFSKFTRATE